MLSNCSPLLRIYEGTYSLAIFKRRLFEQLVISGLPPSPLNDEKHTNATRIFLSLKKLAAEVKGQLGDLSQHGKFESHLSSLTQTVKKLKYSPTDVEAAQITSLKKNDCYPRHRPALRTGRRRMTP